MKTGDVEINIYLLKMIFINICTICTFLKLTNSRKLDWKKELLSFIYVTIISILVTLLKYKVNYFVCIMALIFLLSILCSKIIRSNIGYTILTIIICLSFNYTIYFCAVIIDYIFNKINGQTTLSIGNASTNNIII